MEKGVAPPGGRVMARVFVQAGVACLLGLLLVTSLKTRGPWSAPVRRAVSWAVSTRWQDSAGVRRAEANLTRFVSARSWGAFVHLFGARARSGGVPVAAGPVRVDTPFGWTRHGGGYQFHQGDVLEVTAGAVLYAPARGRLARYEHRTVVMALEDGVRLVLYPVRLLARAPNAVKRGTVVGRAAGRLLRVDATRRGLPVNPASRGLYALGNGV